MPLPSLVSSNNLRKSGQSESIKPELLTDATPVVPIKIRRQSVALTQSLLPKPDGEDSVAKIRRFVEESKTSKPSRRVSTEDGKGMHTSASRKKLSAEEVCAGDLPNKSILEPIHHAAHSTTVSEEKRASRGSEEPRLSLEGTRRLSRQSLVVREKSATETLNSSGNSRHNAGDNVVEETDESDEFLSSGLDRVSMSTHPYLQNPVPIQKTRHVTEPESVQSVQSSQPIVPAPVSQDKMKSKIRRASVDVGMADAIAQALTKTRVIPAAIQEKMRQRATLQTQSQSDLLNSSQNESKTMKRDTSAERDVLLEEGLDPKTRWKKGYKLCRLVYFLMMVHKDACVVLHSIQNSRLIENGGAMALLLRSHRPEPDPSLTSKVLEVIKRGHKRTPENIESLERLLGFRCRSFARFSLNQRMQFCDIMEYEKIPENSIIILEGHVSRAFYFILMGQVEIFKIKDGNKHRLNILKSGDSFGDRTMNLLNDKRTASVAAIMDTELLRVDKSDFFKIANVSDEKSMSNRIAMLATIPHFQNSAAGYLEKLASFFKILRYAPGETIVGEGTDNLDVYFLVSGVCKAHKLVPFIHKTVKVGMSTRKEVRPFVKGIPLGEDEVMVNNNLPVCEYRVGDHFPDMPFPANVDSETPGAFKHLAYIDFIKTLDVTKHLSDAYFTVVADSKVDVAAISRNDYAQIAPLEMILNLYRTQKTNFISVEDLQESFMVQKRWQNHKKKVVGEILSK